MTVGKRYELLRQFLAEEVIYIVVIGHEEGAKAEFNH